MKIYIFKIILLKKGSKDDVQSVEEQFLCGIDTPDVLEEPEEEETKNDGKFV